MLLLLLLLLASPSFPSTLTCSPPLPEPWLGLSDLPSPKHLSDFPSTLSSPEWPSLISQHQPLVVRNASLLKTWLSLGDWSPKGLANNPGPVTTLLATVELASPDYLYTRGDRPAEYEGAKTLKPWQQIPRTQPTLDEMTAQMPSRSPPYLYYTSSLLTGHALGVLPPSFETQVKASFETSLKIRPDTSRPWDGDLTLWLVQSGVCARTHYDAYDNILLMLSGTKVVHLLPPESWGALRLFPRVHPSDRHSQLTDDGALGTLEHQRDKALVVTLEPGDALFIPRCWFHRVHTVKGAVSINVWFRNREFDVVERIYKDALPFRNDKGPKRNYPRSVQNSAAFYTMLKVVRLLKPLPCQAHEFLSQVIAQYSTVLLDPRSAVCNQTFEELLEDQTSGLASAVQETAVTTFQLYQNISIDMRDLFLGQYVQNVAHWIGGTDGVAPVLACLEVQVKDPTGCD